MEAADAAELISEIKEERAEAEATEKFRNVAALTIAIMAMLLAIGSLGGGNATDDMIYGNIKASDTWAFYQAKNVRQTEYRLAADRLELQIADPSLNPVERTAVEAQLARYRETIARYDNEPDPKAPTDSLKGEGKKQLAASRDYWAGPRFTVAGYAADTPGPPQVAQRLSERRAQVVVDALVAAGVRRERLVVAGRGSADPLATPAQSRRVEIKAE